MKPRLLSHFFQHLSRVSLAGLSCGALCEPDFLMATETIPFLAARAMLHTHFAEEQTETQNVKVVPGVGTGLLCVIRQAVHPL